jgi:hypothetical protein
MYALVNPRASTAGEGNRASEKMVSEMRTESRRTIFRLLDPPS